MDSVAALLIVVLMLGSGISCAYAEESQAGKDKPVTTKPTTRKSNRLVHEKSPYLLQHAYNPVDWYPWGNEAFEKARKENKPIFLSIGYSTCHWCHVMEHESFEKDDVAELMNAHFVSIKVDREERPDIDKIYMTAVQATTGSGGWPMSVWLTPDRKPFFCGTYFPPETRYGRPGFKELLQRVHDVWESNHDAVVKQAGEITAKLSQHATIGGNGRSKIDDEPLALGYDQIRGSYDETHGGFGGAPKFPRPVTLNFLLRHFARTGNAKSRDIVLHTLREMAEGGMFDQLGGGFHRYSVDDHWLVSHFEKMLYDQAQLVCSYVEAYQITHDPFYADIARRTCDYVLREMTDPAGGFYSAEDADSEGVEGKFYVWQRKEIEKILSRRSDISVATGVSVEAVAKEDRGKNAAPTMDQAAIDVFCRYYGVEAEGNWEHGNNILHVTMEPGQAEKLFKKPKPEIAGILAAGREKLFAVRAKRIRPHRDEKILTSWNGLMISALARAAQVLDEPKYLQAAQCAATFVMQHHYRDKQLGRTATVPAVVDDYAFFANGLVDLYETDFDPQWLVKAIELTDTMLALFYDNDAGGFFMTSGKDPSVILRVKEEYDGAEPSGNSVAALLLMRLAQFSDNAAYRQAADKTLALFGPRLHSAPSIAPQMLCALDWGLSKPKQIVIAGKPDAIDTRAMLRVVNERFLPNKILLLADGGPGQKMLAKLLPFVETIKLLDGKATAYICVNYACQLPTNDVTIMMQQLESSVPKKSAAKQPK